MKKARPENLAVVIGRNRRVYARIYKMTNRIEGFSEHYYQMEIRKAYNEGFCPIGMKLEKPNDLTWIYRIQYEPLARATEDERREGFLTGRQIAQLIRQISREEQL